jgi:SPP1 gp7 family putative phage head morphogenesis protein
MENNYSRIYVNQSRALYTQRRVTYGNALDSNIDFHTEALYSEIQQEMTDNFKKIYEQSFYRTTYNTIMQVGLMLPFVKPTPKTVNEALKTEWYRATYTDRARQHKLKLADDLKRSVRQSFSAQNKPPQAIKEVTALTQTAENSLVRLNDSHTSFVNDKAVLDSYESTSNLEKYQFIATLDDVTTDICQSLDNKIFELEEAEVGVNYPPMHNRCRSVTIARFEQKELNELYKESQRAARKGVGQKVSGTGKATGKTYTVNANLTYAEWRKQIEE